MQSLFSVKFSPQKHCLKACNSGRTKSNLLFKPTFPNLLGICSLGNNLKAFFGNGPGQDSCSCCTISSFFISVVGNILHKTSTNVLIPVFQFNGFGNRYTILSDLWASKALFNYNIFSLWEKKFK